MRVVIGPQWVGELEGTIRHQCGPQFGKPLFCVCQGSAEWVPWILFRGQPFHPDSDLKGCDNEPPESHQLLAMSIGAAPFQEVAHGG